MPLSDPGEQNFCESHQPHPGLDKHCAQLSSSTKSHSGCGGAIIFFEFDPPIDMVSIGREVILPSNTKLSNFEPAAVAVISFPTASLAVFAFKISSFNITLPASTDIKAGGIRLRSIPIDDASIVLTPDLSSSVQSSTFPLNCILISIPSGTLQSSPQHSSAL